jgi:glycosyltransferase involved in cell wall biosynthesis
VRRTSRGDGRSTSACDRSASEGGKVGGAQQSLELFVRHRPADIDPTVLFFEDGAFAQRIRELGVTTRIAPLADTIRSVTRERLPLSAVRALPVAMISLVSAIRDIAPDVVYTNGIKAHVLASAAARIVGIPSVVHHRDILTGPARLAFLFAIAASSRARIATSKNVARAYPLPNTTVIGNPVELGLFNALPDRFAARSFFGIHDTVPVAAIVGRINRWKGIDRFLRAIASVNRTTQLRGLIVGAPHFRDADLLDELRALRSQLRLDDLVQFSDWVDDTRTIYAAIDINVNSSEREPFGRTIIEAAAAGVPSVCFDDSGVSESVVHGKTGLVVPAGDEAALTAALVAYAGDQNVRSQAGLAARTWSQQFDATAHAELVAGVLRGVLGLP